MPFEKFFSLDTEWGDGVLLEQYNDTFSLYAARKPTNGDGTIYKEWVIPQDRKREPKKKDGKYISIPQKVSLGNVKQATAILKQFIAFLEQDDIPY